METEDYKHLLLAVDFERESEPVVARAQCLRRLMGARLTLLHVIEHVPPAMEYMTLGYAGELALPENSELEAELMAVARRQMDVLGEQLEVALVDRLIRVGPTGYLIDEVAAELEVDLVVLGTHGRHGLLGLFGSTSRAVLRHSKCDVLCVKLHEDATLKNGQVLSGDILGRPLRGQCTTDSLEARIQTVVAWRRAAQIPVV